jgi:type II secretory pathway predicted ATPase ExeA
VARRTIGLRDDQELFEFDINGSDDLYLTEDALYVRAHLRNTALNGGFIAIISEPGGGKTTLANDLEQYALDNPGVLAKKGKQKVVFIRPDHILVERLTASGIYDAIIDDVSDGQERPKRTLEYKSRQARKLLSEAHRNGTRHVLIIEEAQGLAASTLKNLKRFWELKSGHENLLGIVLIGQSELRRHLQDDSWNTREVALRCQVLELKPLDRNEIAEYLQKKFSRLGLDAGRLFEADAYAAIERRLTDGQVSFAYPQRINNLVVRVLNKFANVGGLSKVPGEFVEGDLRIQEVKK